MVSGDGLIHNSKTQKVRCPGFCTRTHFLPPLTRVSCLPLCLPWGQARQLTLTALTGVHLKWHFTNHQSQITELRACCRCQQPGWKPWQWLVTRGHQQMFLSLTVADLTSQFTAGTALLGPRIAELRVYRGTNLSILGGLTWVERPGKDDFQGL